MKGSSVLKDARLRGNFNKWLDKQSVSRYNVKGLDYNAAGQAQNKVGGWKNHQQAPRQDVGRMYQSFFRNRSNEQAGMPRPAQPASAHPPVGPRRV